MSDQKSYSPYHQIL